MQQRQTYPDVKMFIDGTWCGGSRGKSEVVLNPASGLAIGNVPHASVDDLDRALESAWRAAIVRELAGFMWAVARGAQPIRS